ncbi:MAG: hypothetical protein PHO41_05440 [Eubacteriales bacterium]|nr:hypothetical protein [Eubacteriales bacterium]
MRKTAGKRCLLIILCFALLLTAGCKQAEVAAPTLPEGYHTAGEWISGGADVGDINAKSLSVTDVPALSGEAEETALTFSFVTGSRMSGGTEEAPGCGVPAYTVYLLENPHRLVVEFALLAHWDYSHGLSYDSTLVKDDFRQSIFGDQRTSIYFQLDQPALFTVAEDGDTLTVTLRPQPLEEATYYHVTCNAYQEYTNGLFSREFDISPTLPANGTQPLLISRAFQTAEEAEAFRALGISEYPSLLPELWQVVELPAGARPAYDSSLDYLETESTPAARLNGNEVLLPVMAPDGLYLCDTPDGGFLYSKMLDADDGEGYQQIWQVNAAGKQLLTAFEFAAIEQACYSPDGRKLAVLENASGNTHLYVFDTDTYELLNDLSEMGFGTSTSAFIWNSLGNMIYAVSGSGSIQLHQFDYSIPDEQKRHSLIDRNTVEEGSIGYYDGELYFAVSSLEEGSSIYRIKPEGGVRKPFTNGSAFFVSHDDRYMAIITSAESGQTAGSAYSLDLLELATGERSTVTSEFYPYDVLWSQDCTKLYYIESRVTGGQTEENTSGDEGDAPADATDDAASDDPAAEPEEAPATEEAPVTEEDPYPYTLWEYNVATKASTKLIDLCAPDLFCAGENGVFYLCRYDTDDLGRTRFRATYLLDIVATMKKEAKEAAAPTNAEGGEAGVLEPQAQQ